MASRLKPLVLATLLTLPVISQTALALVFDASVDAQQISLGDTLQLTLRIDDANNGKEPDLRGLEKDFRILGKQLGSSTRLSNRGISTETRWTLQLLPKRKGALTIPALNYDGVNSKPIAITVTEASPPNAAQNAQQLVFLEAEVDSKNVYVQQQVNFTLRLYRRTELHDPSLVMPDVENAVQEKIGNPRAYTTSMGGREYEVVENRFAYFPQKSGSFVIPPAELNATIAAGGNGFLDPFLGMMGKQIRRQSNGIEITVRPKPDAYPANAPWIPTPKLTLQESIRPDKQAFRVGDPITRVITLEASGVAPSLLPPLPVPDGNGFKVYPEPADTQSLPDASGISSRRVETHAYIPTRAGTLSLPATEILFWNTRTDRLDKAVLPVRTFTIKAAPGSAATAPMPAQAPDKEPVSTTPAVPTPPAATTNPWLWISAALLLGWLSTLVIGVISLRKRKPRPSGPGAASALADKSLSAKRDALMAACQEQRPVIARQALVAWFKALDHTHAIHSLGHIRHHAMSALLAKAVMELEQTLYRPTESLSWNSDALRKGIADEESQRRIKQRAPRPHLKALHPLS